MLDEPRIAAIEAAIAAQDAQGRAWTNQSVYDVVGGNYGELASYLKARRAQARGAVAVAEAAIVAAMPPPEGWARSTTGGRLGGGKKGTMAGAPLIRFSAVCYWRSYKRRGWNIE